MLYYSAKIKCIKCKKDLKTSIPGGYKDFYCNNKKCSRYGLITAVYIEKDVKIEEC